MSTYMRLFRLTISVYHDVKARKEKRVGKKLTGNLVSILKRTYESLMRMKYISQSTSCMILIHRLDKLLGPSLMNLEHNWSHSIVVS